MKHSAKKLKGKSPFISSLPLLTSVTWKKPALINTLKDLYQSRSLAKWFLLWRDLRLQTFYYPGNWNFIMVINKKIIISYTIAFALLLIILQLFNSAYNELTNFSSLTNQHNSVINYYNDLSQQIRNVTILNPDQTN